MSLSVSGTSYTSGVQPKDFLHGAADNHAAVSTNHNQARTNSNFASVEPSPAKAPAKLTEEQQLQKLIAQGQSTQQIATVLGLTVTQVEQSLAGTSTAASTASSLVALAGRLSVKV